MNKSPLIFISPTFLTLSLNLLGISISLAQVGSNNPLAPTVPSYTSKISELTTNQQKALDIPEVKQMRLKCYQDFIQQNRTASDAEAQEGANKCLQTQLDQLGPDQIKKFANKLQEKKEGTPPPNSGTTGTAGIDPNAPPEQSPAAKFVESTKAIENFQTSAGKSYDVLKKYLEEQLAKEMYGEINREAGKFGKFVDHETYYELFKSRVGKNIISSFSAYCIEAGDNGIISHDKEERAKQREANLQSLSEFENVQQSQTSATGGQQALNPVNNKGYIHFSNCMPRITHLCGRTAFYYLPPQGGQAQLVADYSPAGGIFDPDNNEDHKYTRSQACMVSANLKNLRTQLLEVDKSLLKLKELKDKEDPKLGYQLPEGYEGIYGRTGNPQEKTIDDLTTLTSNELVNKSGLGKELAKDAAQFKRECVDSNSPNCANYGNNAEDYKKFVEINNEHAAKSTILASRLKQMTPLEIKEFLKQEGHTEQEINRILQSTQNDSRALAEKIANRYASEKVALQEALKAKFIEKNFQGADLRSPSGTGNAPNAQEEIKKRKENHYQEMMGNIKYLMQVSAFDNLVQGYLTVEDPTKKKKSRNSQAAHREIQDSALDPAKSQALIQSIQSATQGAPTQGGNSLVPQVNPELFQKLRQETAKNLPKTEKTDASLTTFEAQSLNQLLDNYIGPLQGSAGSSSTPSQQNQGQGQGQTP